MSEISFHYTGEITENHELPLHALAKTLTSLNSAINRAYLGAKYGSGIKNRRITQKELDDAKFWAGKAKDGGHILDLICKTEYGQQIVDNISDALARALDNLQIFDPYTEELTLEQQAEQLRDKLNTHSETILFNVFSKSIEEDHQNKYIDKSILKELIPVTSMLQGGLYGESQLEMEFTSTTPRKIEFNKHNVHNFSKMLTQTHLGPLVIYDGDIFSTHKYSKNGKFKNIANKQTARLKTGTETAFFEMHEAQKSPRIQFIGTPVFEYNTTDAESGDIFFLKRIG
ncbi:hypothetical protein [Maridesulfovibrio salexigens]|uniref:Uncharacterized protein n=1 Tax=Maridesulfovibrio salexigens (strain ATCC 14822 / DSM 2638 / NCIMB 8403 / VKM B-1763) TaxID=526222 RepID=C6BY58_MARSD|nr:hypothetical protein [Maridesulfovibrio salexigens]ACS80588.1 hypothetical protein Desal_2532 [Maridesulfovibrio salexigens DSM 2638]